ncbi:MULTISPECIES: signal peptidase [Chryseobacterium]|jgi:hypothetical protein|uniref:Signal peptidase n=1 Tax=Chryseobacterium nepalense TaxID=1854498 RepID=A0ABY4K474_9FLAO|nr:MULTISPECIES: signal peptidase [Chryseobacterium]MEA1849678.1 signal peptidase [Chryseobacterium sp. MHB01]MEC5172260.1 hypothetical protein [Chryseobacterium nepalense]UPQ75161.1 signal peptidase [Chryseobacterium nepalense]
MKTINKLVIAFFLLPVLWISAQPPIPGGGGNGGNGTGSESAPVAMYVYLLAIIAILLILIFGKKYMLKKI